MRFDGVSCMIPGRFEARPFGYGFASRIIENLMTTALSDLARNHPAFRTDCYLNDHIALPVVAKRLARIVISGNKRP